MMIYPAKILSGIVAGMLSAFVQNLLPLFVTVTIFEGVDFVTGVIKSGVVARRAVEAVFDTATVAKKIGLGYIKAQRGDFNDDFNNDFYNNN